MKDTVGKVLLALRHYCLFFLIVAFSITCCMMLFVSTFSMSLGVEMTRENMGMAAKLTFGNVCLVSFLFFLLDAPGGPSGAPHRRRRGEDDAGGFFRPH